MRDGRTLGGFSGVLIGVCCQPGDLPQTEPFPFFIGKVGVSKNGKFSKSLTVKQEPYDQAYKLNGKLKKNRVVKGRLVLEGACEVHAEFTATRDR